MHPVRSPLTPSCARGQGAARRVDCYLCFTNDSGVGDTLEHLCYAVALGELRFLCRLPGAVRRATCSPTGDFP